MMKTKMVTGLVSCALYLPLAQAGGLNITDADLTLAGGVTAGVLYSDNTGGSNNTETTITDVLLELSAPADKGLGFVAAYGSLPQNSIVSNVPAISTSSASDMKLQYGYLTVKPTDAITVDVGVLGTKIGYEVANTYANAHVLLGAVWNAQPVYYDGIRASFAVGEGSMFVEANEDTATGATTGYVIGGSTKLGAADLSVAYYNANKARDIIDIILSSEIAGIPVAANIDFQKLDSEATTPGMDDNAIGIALYATPKVGAYTVPLRFEYLDDDSSGIYGGVKSGYTITVTPTYHYGKNAFVRAELALAASDNKIFTDKNSVAQDSKTSAALQAGFTF